MKISTNYKMSINKDGAIAEKPRNPTDYPLLNEVYRRHDDMISSFTNGRTVEIASGMHKHSDADVTLDIFSANKPDIVGDARNLPFKKNSFDTVIGRRFLHHVKTPGLILEEIQRILRPNGLFILLEGTPGWYRLSTKWVGFKLGILGEDTDEYGHLSNSELEDLLNVFFDIDHIQPVGSILMLLTIFNINIPYFRKLLDATQFATWWTFVVTRNRRR
jgi:SAM-dependent methyltransferase